MESATPALNETFFFLDLDKTKLSNQLSPTTRLILILFFITFGIVIAWAQVLPVRYDAARPSPFSSSTIKKTTRRFFLNIISGVLVMMATSIGAYDQGLAAIKDVHGFWDPRLTQWKVDRFRVQLVHWFRYTSGWQLVENLATHAYNVHLWALPIEFRCLMAIFMVLILLARSPRPLRIALLVSCTLYSEFTTFWTGWFCFAVLLLLQLDWPRLEKKQEILPLTETKGHKPSLQCRKEMARGSLSRISIAILGLYLLSAPHYGFVNRGQNESPGLLNSPQVA